MITIAKAGKEDAEKLVSAKKDAFSWDVNIYGYGPPEYDSIDKQIETLENEKVRYFKILDGDTVVGGMCVFLLGKKHCHLGALYIIQAYQNKKIGTKAVEFLFNAFPEYNKWTLETPYKSFRNHHFYEKLGFRKTGETKPEADGFFLYLYEKSKEQAVNFRKAAQNDLKNIMQVYEAAVKRMDELGIHQWDEVYPSESIVKADIRNKELYIGFSGNSIVSVFTLNPMHNKEYETGDWQYDNVRYSVIHRLCVNPACQNKGVGTQTMKYIEDTFRNENIEAVRLDAFSQNPAALRLYEKLGYKKVGEVLFRKGLFFLFEKKL
ncbi:MAG: GNAT family N-acetyltransferase [Bacillota bacterium]|nr:GNAT family N-acetyltransferase [Bacillota bacterium]